MMQPPRAAPYARFIHREKLQKLTRPVRKYIKCIRLGFTHQGSQPVCAFAQIHHAAVNVYLSCFDKCHPRILSEMTPFFHTRPDGRLHFTSLEVEPHAPAVPAAFHEKAAPEKERL